jgi:hypothetical protein
MAAQVLVVIFVVLHVSDHFHVSFVEATHADEL